MKIITHSAFLEVYARDPAAVPGRLESILDATTVRHTSTRLGIGCFAVVEGGYNQRVLGGNVLAFLQGLEGS